MWNFLFDWKILTKIVHCCDFNYFPPYRRLMQDSTSIISCWLLLLCFLLVTTLFHLLFGFHHHISSQLRFFKSTSTTPSSSLFYYVFDFFHITGKFCSWHLNQLIVNASWLFNFATNHFIANFDLEARNV